MSGRARNRFHPASAPTLPSDKAFVLQLDRSTDPELRSFAGRVEHLATGRRRRFESVREFLEEVTGLLAGAQDVDRGRKRIRRGPQSRGR